MKKLLFKIFKILIWILLAIGVLIGILYFVLKSSNETAYKEAMENTPYDVIIVPGLPFNNQNQYGDLLLMRIYWSKYLIDQKVAKRVIYSGSAVYTPYVEAKIMKQIALGIGLPDSIIYTEEKAEHSSENAYYGLQIALTHNWKKVAVATDPVQSFMLQRYIDHHNLDLYSIPMQFGELDKSKMTFPEIDPQLAFEEHFIALPERESWFTRFYGTLGNHINYQEKSN